ncbi:hypothetical protein [Chitinophaga polysaccharea]|uniref:hypothetical protein n=1 Tax=Chitinophaga polysaccharea TaxID=1293035 RepID=UPI00115AB59D|nr:hypothetical protein [Chitinophaga polysaccharea]
MKKILFLLLLLTGTYPLYTAAQSNYDHKVIAVLPVRTTFAEYRSLSDSSMKAFMALEIKYGIQLQEALYQTITSDTGRLLVEVQSWQTTDSILKRAGLDLRKVPYLDMSAIAKVLKVDACITTTATLSSRGNVAVGAPAPWPIGLAASEGLSQALRAIKRNNKMFTFRLMDGKSGDEVWTFSQEMTAGDISLDKDQLVFSPLIFKRFKKRFPYCD